MTAMDEVVKILVERVKISSVIKSHRGAPHTWWGDSFTRWCEAVIVYGDHEYFSYDTIDKSMRIAKLYEYFDDASDEARKIIGEIIDDPSKCLKNRLGEL
jgi:hypothetical protein